MWRLATILDDVNAIRILVPMLVATRIVFLAFFATGENYEQALIMQFGFSAAKIVLGSLPRMTLVHV